MVKKLVPEIFFLWFLRRQLRFVNEISQLLFLYHPSLLRVQRVCPSISKSWVLTEPIFGETLISVVCLSWLVINVGHLLFSLHMKRSIFLFIDISFLIEMSFWCSRLWPVACGDVLMYASSLQCILICPSIIFVIWMCKPR